MNYFRVFLFISFISSLSAFSILRNELKKRAEETQICHLCQSEGSSCNDYTDPQCEIVFESCYSNARNGTEECGCIEEYYNCTLNGPPGGYDEINNIVFLCQNHYPTCNCSWPTLPEYTIKTCTPETYCSPGSKTCVSKIPPGGDCDPNISGICQNEFTSSKYYSCNRTTSKCELTRPAGAGDPCQTSADCFDNSPCDGGICIGKSKGETCHYYNSCAFGLYCDGTCTPRVKDGDSCELNENSCEDGSFCHQDSKICMRYFSLKEGDTCNDLNLGECGKGLICFGTCQKAPSSPVPCERDSDCLGGYCICSSKTCGEFYIEEECVDHYLDFIDCAKENKCPLSVDSDSCAMRNCEELGKCALSCIYNPIFGQDPKCYQLFDDGCSLSSGTSLAIFQSLIFFALAIISLC